MATAVDDKLLQLGFADDKQAETCQMEKKYRTNESSPHLLGNKIRQILENLYLENHSLYL